ncbi:MAG: nucleotide exchange factor GrpE [Crenarchaeota archaeon]|nr:MAG: nucleotide exchange factor GrpE [Thermoproteota archaeon]RDJ33377.1 MAG: nucleotide exchange factor GrpE [Thermoproteota archaeon]RDJ36118.1 MAG: nucleotide exchange factor GrpE [Thermoproteota archaeon]RDJ38751.1 MAG: nucleotide exchange factor GrpE [Thermoproteota archaeon]
MSEDDKNEVKLDFSEDDDIVSTEKENSEKESNASEILEQLTDSLNKEKQKSLDLEDKLKRVFADFQNLEKKSQTEIKNSINNLMDKFILDFLQIYDDFIRAKNAYSENKIETTGLDSILKNMDALLSKNGIVPIDALGEIFDPNLHEAIAIREDPSLDDDTITKEIRKGYISHNRVIRPTLVEISKKQK